MKLRQFLSLSALVFLVACTQTPVPVVTPPVTEPPIPTETPVETAPPEAVPSESRLDTLPGWDLSDASLSLAALKATCTYKNGTVYVEVCQRLKLADLSTNAKIKDFFVANFELEAIDGQGLMTGYYVPEYQAKTSPDEEFSQPVRDRPDDLVTIEGAKLTPPSTATKIAARKEGDKYVPYYSRAEIEAMPSDATLFMRPEDYFYMQLQGSGFLSLPDETEVYAAYADNNGQPFVGIAKTMVEKGYLKANETSGDNIHAWLAAHRGPEAQSVMNTNTRYAFFEIRPTQSAAIGAANIGLPPKAAIAIDQNYHKLGELFWLEADTGSLAGSFPAYHTLVVALDTGGAIKGNIRADYYLGVGKAAGTEAGRIKHNLKLWRIVPVKTKP